MVFLGVLVCAEVYEGAVFEEGIAVADDRRPDFLLDEVIGEQAIDTRIAIVKDVEGVFTVGRGQGAFEEHLLHVGLEELA